MTDDDVAVGQVRNAVSPSHLPRATARLAEKADHLAGHAHACYASAGTIADEEPSIRMDQV